VLHRQLPCGDRAGGVGPAPPLRRLTDPTDDSMKPLTYRAAGVDIDAGDDAVRRIATLARSTARPEVLAGVGGFAALVTMPDLYAPGEYDLAGFAVGVAERLGLVDGARVRPGDVVLGLPSSGLHSNGYTLARRIVFDVMKLTVDALLPGTGRTVGDELLTPTR